MVTARTGISRWQLLRLGRDTHGGTAADWLHRAALAGAAAALTLACGAFSITHVVYGAIDHRIEARTPRSTSQPGKAVAYYEQAFDTWNLRQFPVVYVAPARPGIPPPPGLAAWPGPGDAVLSPALLAADSGGVLAKRFGTLVGTIEPAGLATSGEWYAYVGATPGALRKQTPYAVALTGFGVAARPGESVLQRAFEADAQSEGTFDWLLAFTLLLPALIWIVTAARSGSVARDRRLALIHALGAAPRHRRWIVIGEALPWVGCGALAGLVAMTALASDGIDLPRVHFDVAAADSSAALPLVFACALGSFAVVLVACVALHPRRRLDAVRPVQRSPRLPLWRLLLVVAAYVYALTRTTRHADSASRTAAVLSVYVALALSPLIVGYLVAWLGRAGLRLARHRGWAAALVGAAWLREQPRTAMRLGAALVVSVALTGQIQASMSAMTHVEKTQIAEVRARAVDVVTVTAANFSADPVGRFSSLLPGARILAVDTATAGRTIASGSPATLRFLGAASCPRTPVAASALIPRPAAAALPLLADLESPGDSLLLSCPGTTAVPTQDTRLVVLAGPGATRDQIEQAAFAAFIGPQVAGSDLTASGNGSQFGVLGDWVLLFGLLGLPLLLAAGTLAWLGIMLEQTGAIGFLGAFTGTGGFYRRVAGWNLAVPLLAATGVAAACDLVLGRVEATMRGGNPALFSLTVWACCVGLCLALALLATAVGGEVLRRGAAAWRPGGE